jgi:hypothetical protein
MSESFHFGINHKFMRANKLDERKKRSHKIKLIKTDKKSE